MQIDLKKHLDSTNLPPEEQHVVIVGGGLLGLELAAALKHKKVRTTIIQRASRLMERQLDRISSKLLAEEVQLRDIQIYFDNEVSTVFETDNPNEIEIALKSGTNYYCQCYRLHNWNHSEYRNCQRNRI